MTKAVATSRWRGNDTGLPEHRISTQSLWSHAVWRLDDVRPGTHPGNYALDWRFMMPDGSRFTDPRWTAWHEAAKSFLISLRNEPPQGRSRSSDATIMSVFKRLRVLIRWMAGEGHRGFADLDQDAASQFMLAMRGRHLPGTTKTISTSTVIAYGEIVRLVYLQADKLPDGGPPEDPFPGLTVSASIGAMTRTARVQSLPHTPDAVAVPLIAAALRLIGRPADDVVALRDRAQAVYDSVIAAGISQTKAGFAVTAALPDFHFAVLPGEDAPWSAEPVTSTKQIRELVDRVTDACFVVIAYLIGARVSEILSLETGCVEHHPSSDGIESFAYVRGKIWKTASDPTGRPHRWVAPEPVVRAIAVMERLSVPLQQREGSSTLFLAMHSSGLIGPAPQITVPGVSTWNKRLNDLFAPYIGLPAHEGEPWRLTTHQGRKTFARFLGKRDRTGLDALRAHLGHVSRMMTDSAYVGTDFQLGELVDRQTLEETRDALEELLTAPALSGKGGRSIAARSPFRGRTRDGDVKTYVEFILSETDMRLGVCDWGYCVYRRESAACQGDDHGPNPVLRTQSVCASCANFAVTDKHRPVWEARRRRNLDLMALPLDPESAKLARDRVDECDRVLAQFSELQAEHNAI